MKGSTMLATLYELGVTPSRSRPRVSNDNPYSESVFKTCKYRPEYPAKGFVSLDAAREWVLKFARWYRHEHHHSSIKFVTPNQLHTGKAENILQKRHYVYEAARARTPWRWTGKIHYWTLPDEIWLNPVNIPEKSLRQLS
jgi:putative transposase